MKKNTKNLLRQVLPMLLAAFMILGLTPGLEKAFATSKEYTYTVRIFSGKQADVKDKNGGSVDVIEFKDLPFNYQFDKSDFDWQKQVNISNDSKYYVRGLRESGRDNNTVGLSSFKVTRDIDLVVAYGIKGNSVAYTINYQDADGNALAPSETYYGNVGDRPVLAYLYIEGYYPQAYNLRGRLKANAAENVFTFIYYPLERETAAATTTAGGGGTPASPTTAPTAAPTQAPAGGNQGGTGGNQGGTGGNQEANPEAEGQAAAPEVTPPAQTQPEEPQELIDVDETVGPQAEFTGESTEGAGDETEETGETVNVPDNNTPEAGGLSTPVKVGIGLGIVALLALILWFVLVYSKRNRK
ncbi:MAG: hypothetical protein J6N77_04540 [Lachnospiraceae bacterium]|nr:hypothetical protein [Lachnospiraceae bacterium]